ncbi:MAG: 30S ribosomal protein S12 methylthiotransferase RimO [Acidobacteria bacterium]|nr:30S ribosomal protein S12 methylthiotransferase RimO [Acidobacteriota bacterium]
MKKIGFVSLGCEKNLVDTEVMMGMLSRRGYEMTAHPVEADVIVVNTCGFIDKAKKESIDTILEMAEFKNTGNCSRLVVTGCLVERYRADLQREIPEVDAVLGTTQLESIIDVCEDQPGPTVENPYYLYDENSPRLLTTPRYTAYIKIAEGCDRPCSFCIIPKIRGHYRSRPLQSILNEARYLSESGVKEVVLISQETTRYGDDLGLKHGLSDLLRQLATLEGLHWVRFLYCFPSQVDDALLTTMREVPKVCKYMDMPLQHANGRILRSMKRGGNAESLKRLVGHIREQVPGVTMRTSMIAGYPGETGEEFNELCSFVEEMQFDRLGTFTYSDEVGTASQMLGQKLGARVINSRRSRLMQIQVRISKKKNRQHLGQRYPLLVEGQSEETDLLWQGRLESQAPRIDGVVLINDVEGVAPNPGDFRSVEITQTLDYDLVGKLV